MKKLICLLALFVALAPAAARAQSAFDGTWKIDLKSMKADSAPMVLAVRDVMFQCKNCPVKALILTNGSEQHVNGNVYADQVSAKVVDKNSVETTGKKNGKEVSWTKYTVAADGNNMTVEYRNSYAAQPVTGKLGYKRVARDPASTHPLAGSWRLVKVEGRSDNGLTMTYKSFRDNMNWSAPSGESYSAKINGADGAMKGEPGIFEVSLKLADKTVLEEVFKHSGEVVATRKSTLDATGATATVEWNDKRTETSGSYTMVKQ